MKKLFESADKLHYKNNTIITPKNEVFLVSSGVVSLEAMIDGQDSNIQFYKAGDVILQSLVTPDSEMLPGLTFHYRCVGNVTLLRQPSSLFQITSEAYVQQLQIQNKLLAIRLAGLSYRDVNRRLAARLLYLVERFGVNRNNTATISVPLTHRQIAGSVSSTRETVNKLIRKLISQGVISMKSRSIQVHSLDSLKQLLAKKG